MSVQTNLWDACQRLLLVFPYGNATRYDEYKKAFDKLLNESKVQEVQLVVHFANSDDLKHAKQHSLIHFISKKSFTFMGKLKDYDLMNVFIQPYDLVIICEINDRLLLKVLEKMHAPNKIAVNTSISFCAVNAKSKSDMPAEIVNFGKQTLLKINNT